jgi:hypothetical protein
MPGLGKCAVETIAWPQGPSIEKSAKSDRSWFRKHPNRRWRIRPFIQGEDAGAHNAPLSGFRAFTFVERLPSGGFVRRWFMTRGQPANSDQTAALIFAVWTYAGEDAAILDIPPDSELKRRGDFARAVAPLYGGDPEEEFHRTVCELAFKMGAAQ